MSSPPDNAMLIGEEDSQLLTVSSRCFGAYSAPRQRIVSMTSLQIIAEVTNLTSAAQQELCSPAVVVRLDPELDVLLRTLTCGDQLRADLPVLFQNQLASLIVKCWTYLVWMHMIETDDAPVGEQIRDQILWSLMRAFEPSHSTHPMLSHGDNRHAKTKIKQSLKLTALLLCHHSLLVKFVTLGNISADALVSLTQQQLNINTLRLLVDRADRVSSRITKRNIRSLLIEPVDVDEPMLEQGAVTLTSPISAERAAHELLTLTQSSSSSSPPPSFAPPTPSPLIAAADVTSAESISTDPSVSTSATQHGTTISRERENHGSTDEENDSDGDEEDAEGEAAEEESDNESAMSIDNNPRSTRKRIPTRKKKRPRRRAPSFATSEVLPQAVHQQQPPQRSVPLKPQPSALQRLSAVTFRAPDNVRGCVDDDTVHDLFCRHHLAWRRGVLEELALLSPSELAAIREQHTESPASTVADLYLGLARRWGQCVHFVAPLQIEDDVAMEQALAHVSLEPEAHDAGCFYSHEELNHLLSPQDTTYTSAKDYDFNDPDITLCSADPRKYWVFASDHDRDDAGGNSAHMLALYRVFSGDDQASFDSHSGVVIPLPVELFLRFGCMLVVVVQTEGAVVYVPSATNNESAHLVTTTSDRAAISVGGNVLNPRHITRLIRQHEDEGPLEAIRLEWARDFSGTSPEVAETESYRIGSAESLLWAPTAAAIHDMHKFLCGVTEDDARYQPEYYRQSWIPDLFSTSQACRILSEVRDHNDTLPLSMVMEQLLDAGRFCTPETRSVLAALATKAASTAVNKPMPPWHACTPRLGCPAHMKNVGGFQPVHSIKRPPILLSVTGADTTLAQEDLMRHIHQGIRQGAVVCKSLVPREMVPSQPVKKRRSKGQHQHQQTSANASDGDASPYEFQKWSKLQSNGNDALTVRWMEGSLRERGVVYLTDIAADKERIAAASVAWNDKAEAIVRQLVGEQTFSGFLLRHCLHRSPGVHSPSFYALFSSERGRITSPHHNESHRVAAWHLLLRHPKSESNSIELCSSNSNSNGMSAPSYHAVPSPVSMCRTSPESISQIHQAMTAKSKVIAGSDHLLDDIDSDGGSRRRKSSARDLYPDSVSLAFGELTEDSSWKVLKALAMTSNSRLLDVGSAFGRFCVHAALGSPMGVSVTGIEAGIKRAQLASQFLEELTHEHSAIMAPVRPHIKLVHGDILCHLPELFAHSHVFLFDARFMESTWRILAHLLSYLSGVTEQVVISCQPLHTCNADFICGDPVSLSLSGGKQPFTAHVYRVSSRMKHRHAVEVFVSPVHGLGVRAVRALRVGQTIMRVIGEEIYNTTFAQKSDVAKQGMYPYLTRMPSLDKPGQRAFLHALDVSRYINSHVNTPHTQNVAFKVVDSELYVVAVREIGRGEELLHHYENWSTNGERPWLTDQDLLQ